MRVLVFAALYPPEYFGGAEISAANLSRWLAAQGHDVVVLATARSKSEECRDVLVDGVRLWRIRTAHLYPMIAYPGARPWQKPIWHLQDHLDPRNAARIGEILDAVGPDFVNIHILQGLGYAALGEIGRRGLPALYVLHDLGLACIRMTMNGPAGNCAAPCRLCRLSSAFKLAQLRQIERLGLMSPSAANLATLRRFLPVGDLPARIVPNANRYPPPSGRRQDSAVTRLLYVGRLQRAKGIAVLLDALERLEGGPAFQLDIVGSGPDEAALRSRFARPGRIRFYGAVTEARVGEFMLQADLLCVPSIWHENWPGVVVRALGMGLPVLASQIGGMPELVRPGWNGDLVEPGAVDAWAGELSALLKDPARIAGWRANALSEPLRFDQDQLGRQILDFMAEIAMLPGRRESSPSSR